MGWNVRENFKENSDWNLKRGQIKQKGEEGHYVRGEVRLPMTRRDDEGPDGEDLLGKVRDPRV